MDDEIMNNISLTQNETELFNNLAVDLRMSFKIMAILTIIVIGIALMAVIESYIRKNGDKIILLLTGEKVKKNEKDKDNDNV